MGSSMKTKNSEKAPNRSASLKAHGPALAQKMDADGEHLRRVRRICLALPGASEKISHGEPTFFAGKKVFAMFADNHHGDGRVAV
jgi:hypothetical protein